MKDNGIFQKKTACFDPVTKIAERFEPLSDAGTPLSIINTLAYDTNTKQNITIITLVTMATSREQYSQYVVAVAPANLTNCKVSC